MTPYVKSKYDRLKEMIDILAERQVWIRKEINKSQDQKRKEVLGLERTDNSAAIRCMHWIKWTLQGIPPAYKLLRDPKFIEWISKVYGYHIHETLASELGFEREDYWNQYKWTSPEYKYFSQRNIFWYLWDYLFPERYTGIFRLQTDEEIENDVWRTKFSILITEEQKIFKERQNIEYYN